MPALLGKFEIAVFLAEWDAVGMLYHYSRARADQGGCNEVLDGVDNGAFSIWRPHQYDTVSSVEEGYSLNRAQAVYLGLVRKSSPLQILLDGITALGMPPSRYQAFHIRSLKAGTIVTQRNYFF